MLEKGHGFFYDGTLVTFVADKLQGIDYRIPLDTAIEFGRYAVHQNRDDFQIVDVMLDRDRIHSSSLLHFLLLIDILCGSRWDLGQVFPSPPLPARLIMLSSFGTRV
jgi:hypothetical protein